MVLLTRRGRRRAEGARRMTQALIIGASQGLAVLPGLTRSGTTIACAMLLGLSGPAAFRFSFLMSLPAIAGATLLTLRKTQRSSPASASAGARRRACARWWSASSCLVWLPPAGEPREVLGVRDLPGAARSRAHRALSSLGVLP